MEVFITGRRLAIKKYSLLGWECPLSDHSLSRLYLCTVNQDSYHLPKCGACTWHWGSITESKECNADVKKYLELYRDFWNILGNDYLCLVGSLIWYNGKMNVCRVLTSVEIKFGYSKTEERRGFIHSYIAVILLLHHFQHWSFQMFPLNMLV